MSNDSFQFRQFTVRQDRCAMKVGTDGTLLGAWAHGGRRVLDIGTGTGLIALMMAQRFPDAQVTAVEIDAEAAAQARDNVLASPFVSRISVVCADISPLLTSPLGEEKTPPPAPPLDGRGVPPPRGRLGGGCAFDAIVCNPPFFVASLQSPDPQRTQARHTTTLTYTALMNVASRLLSADGELSVVIPAECRSGIEAEAALAGLMLRRRLAVKTLPHKPPRRFLLAFGHQAAPTLDLGEAVLEESPGVRSPWYRQLTSDFYLK